MTVLIVFHLIQLLILDRYDRFSFDLNDSISIPISKAKDYLAENQLGPAALVLDALTVVLLPADNERCSILLLIRIIILLSLGDVVG